MNPDKEFRSFVKRIISVLENENRTIFKGGIVLFGVCLVGLSQVFPILIDMDYKARAIQFEIEAQEKKPISELDCYKIAKKIDKCLLAKYQSSTNENTFSLAALLIVLLFYTGMLFVLFSFMGFIISSFPKKSSVSEKPEVQDDT